MRMAPRPRPSADPTRSVRWRTGPRRVALAAAVATAAALAVAPLSPSGGAARAATPPAWTLTPTSEGYLGASVGFDRQNGVAVQPGGVVVVGGRAASLPYAGRPLLGGGTGTIVRLAPGGARIVGTSRLPGEVEGLAADMWGHLGVIGPFGMARLWADGQRVAWRVAMPAAGGMTDEPGRRIAVGADGMTAGLASKQITLVDRWGRVHKRWTVRHSWVNDVAVDWRTKRVFVTGFDQAEPNLQVAFVEAYDYAGVLRWRNYGWSAPQVGTLRADTRGYRVAMGADGRLYFAGESAGGNSIFHRGVRDLSKAAALVKYDRYNDPYNTGSNHITFYARLDPLTGAHLLGQWSLARLSPEKGYRGNTITVRALAADAKGNVYVGGEAACCIENRKGTVMRIAGRTLPPYGGDFYVLAVAADFRSRTTWVAFGGNGQINGVAARLGYAVAVGSASSKGAVVHNPVQAAPAGNVSAALPDGFVSVWRIAG